MIRKNINRGFTKLRVWQDSSLLYSLTAEIFLKFPFDLKRVASNTIDASHSICRNIAEGYCRRGIKEYLNFLNIALGSCGELNACYLSCKEANQITEAEFKKLDELHYKVENELLKLIKSLQKKKISGNWEDNFYSQ
jgi:four helix bundle protein